VNCPICASEMVLAQATDFGDQYHYCRNCKKELSEMTAVQAPTRHTVYVQPQGVDPFKVTCSLDCILPYHKALYGQSRCACGKMELSAGVWREKLATEPETNLSLFGLTAWLPPSALGKIFPRTHEYDPMTRACTCGSRALPGIKLDGTTGVWCHSSGIAIL
jgi:hypothetical protein